MKEKQNLTVYVDLSSSLLIIVCKLWAVQNQISTL